MSRAVRPLRIGFIHNAFPLLSQTFINKEMIGLAERGLPLYIYSLFRPDEDEIDRSFPSDRPVAYLLHTLSVGRLFAAHFKLLLVSTGRYVSTAFWAYRHGSKGIGISEIFKALIRPRSAKKAVRQDVRLHFILAAPAAVRMRRDGITFVNSHFADAAASFAVLTARLLGISYAVTTHAYDIFTPQVLSADKLAGARFILTCTRYNLEALRAQFGNEIAEKCRVFYHGIDCDRFQRRERPRNTVPEILSIGRLTPKKGFDLLIDACSLLRNRGIEFACTLVGEGPQRKQLEELIERSALRQQVSLVGAVQPTQTRNFYERADLFVLPCRIDKHGDRDGIPNVIAEAMAMELPVVSTRISGIPELVMEGETGFLVPQNDVEALAETIIRMLQNEEMRLRFGRVGRKRVMEMFDSKKCLDELYEFYCRELGR